MHHTDVFVCGAGPAGLAAAIACRLQGFDVLLAESSTPPVDKACGEGLLPDALAALGRLGVDLQGVPAAPLCGIRFVEANTSAQARFGERTGRGVRRTHLHAVLRERAEALGVRVLWATQVLSLEPRATPPGVTLKTTAGAVHARWCVGADGLQSRVRLWSGLDRGRPQSRRIGLRTHFRMAPWSDLVEVYWGRSGQAYITPVAPDEVSLAVVARCRYASIDAALEEFPALAARLRGAVRTSTERGAATSIRRLPRVTAGAVALLGDASGSIDAVTGAGLGLAFEQALALAPALRVGDLRPYERAHRAIGRRPALMAHGLLLLDRFPALRAVTLAAFRRIPGLFNLMLAFHAATSPVAALTRPAAHVVQQDPGKRALLS